VVIFEMTREHHILVPVAIAVVLAHVVRRIFTKESIYARSLLRLRWQQRRQRHRCSGG
jgi:H+/Cl- antiporter ClcA